jgi:cupin fold WbuC family metalloprotein
VTAILAYREQSPEVYYPSEPLVVIDEATIAFLKARAAQNPRLRSRLCMHSDPGDVLHEMLIVHHRDVYVRPHRHVGKAESFHLVEGAATVVLMDENGRPTASPRLGRTGSGKPFFCRIPENVMHTLLIESEWLVFIEATTGPFERAKTQYLTGSPDGSDTNAARRYLEGLAKAIGR